MQQKYWKIKSRSLSMTLNEKKKRWKIEKRKLENQFRVSNILQTGGTEKGNQ